MITLCQRGLTAYRGASRSESEFSDCQWQSHLNLKGSTRRTEVRHKNCCTNFRIIQHENTPYHNFSRVCDREHLIISFPKSSIKARCVSIVRICVGRIILHAVTVGNSRFFNKKDLISTKIVCYIRSFSNFLSGFPYGYSRCLILPFGEDWRM